MVPRAERWQKGTVRMHLVILSCITAFHDLTWDGVKGATPPRCVQPSSQATLSLRTLRRAMVSVEPSCAGSATGRWVGPEPLALSGRIAQTAKSSSAAVVKTASALECQAAQASRSEDV